MHGSAATGRIWTRKREPLNVPLSKYSLGSVEFSSLRTRLDISSESDLKAPGTEARPGGGAKGYLFSVLIVGCKPIASRAREHSAR